MITILGRRLGRLFDLVSRWCKGVQLEPLTQIEVTLIPAVVQELSELGDRNGLSRTDNVNRAITVYAFLEDLVATGHDIFLRRRRRPWWNLFRPVYETVQVVWE